VFATQTGSHLCPIAASVAHRTKDAASGWFFAEITRKHIRRGVFKSVDELKQAIMDYLDNHNGHPKPYVWTKTAAEIFSKVARAKQALESQHKR
jgi:hypothetical protein